MDGLTEGQRRHVERNENHIAQLREQVAELEEQLRDGNRRSAEAAKRKKGGAKAASDDDEDDEVRLACATRNAHLRASSSTHPTTNRILTSTARAEATALRRLEVEQRDPA